VAEWWHVLVPVVAPVWAGHDVMTAGALPQPATREQGGISLGAYPADPYFDPERPAWLPYWIDTPTESAFKWGLYPRAAGEFRQPSAAPPEPAPGPAAPETPTEMYNWTPADQEARTRAAWEEWRRRAIPDLPGSPEPWEPPRLDDLTLGAVILAGVAVILLWRRKR